VKKTITIICLIALLLSTSSFSFYLWIREQVHEAKVFAMIHNNDLKQQESRLSFSFIVENKNVLPKGYSWEEKGREFSHDGKLYDIVSTIKTNNGWKITAVSDDIEVKIVDGQLELAVNNTSSLPTKSKIKVSISQFVYDKHGVSYQRYFPMAKSLFFDNYLLSSHCIYIGQESPPPQLQLI
jgi:hypothetical protein